MNRLSYGITGTGRVHNPTRPTPGQVNQSRGETLCREWRVRVDSSREGRAAALVLSIHGAPSLFVAGAKAESPLPLRHELPVADPLRQELGVGVLLLCVESLRVDSIRLAIRFDSIRFAWITTTHMSLFGRGHRPTQKKNTSYASFREV